jgi:hypothetical protein
MFFSSLSSNDQIEVFRGVSAGKIEFVERTIVYFKEFFVAAMPEPKQAFYRGANGERVGDIVIPKTLYDLFVLHFFAQGKFDFEEQLREIKIQQDVLWGRLEDVFDHLGNYLPGIGYEEFKAAEERLDEEKNYWSDRVLLFIAEGDEKVATVVNRHLTEFRSSKKFVLMGQIVEQGILQYFEDNGIVETNFSWEQTRDCAVDLLSNIALQGARLSEAEVETLQTSRDKAVLRFLWCEDHILKPEKWMVILLGVRHEYDSAPGTCSIYRGGSLAKDDMVKEGRVHSLSFGQSVLTGVAYDYSDGSPLGFSGADFYAVDILEDEENSVFYIPKLEGVMRFFERGEIGHARTRFFDTKSRSGVAAPLVEIKTFSDVLASRFFESEEEYLNVAQKYLREHRIPLRIDTVE